MADRPVHTVLDVSVGRSARLVVLADCPRNLTAREVDFIQRFAALAGPLDDEPSPGAAPPRCVIVVRPGGRRG